MHNHFKNILLVIIGTLLFAISVNGVTIPNELGEGGVTGFVLFLNYTLGLNIALTSLIINGFLLILGLKLLDKTTIFYTLVSIISLSVFLEIVKIPPFIPTNQVTAGILKGALMGAGLGIVLLGNGSTGGTDIIALIINKITGISFSTVLFVSDIFIIGLLMTAIGIEKGIITMIAIYITSNIINFMITGLNPKQAFYIISKEHEAIGQAILNEINRGVTVLSGHGLYSKEERHVLFVVVSRRQVMKLQRLIQSYDKNAFVTVSAVQEVHGEGFTYVLNKTEP